VITCRGHESECPNNAAIRCLAVATDSNRSACVRTVGSSNPEVAGDQYRCLAVAFGANTLQHLTRTHIKKLNVSFCMSLFVARHKIAQHVPTVRSVDEKRVPICGSSYNLKIKCWRRSTEGSPARKFVLAVESFDDQIAHITADSFVDLAGGFQLRATTEVPCSRNSFRAAGLIGSTMSDTVECLHRSSASSSSTSLVIMIGSRGAM